MEFENFCPLCGWPMELECEIAGNRYVAWYNCGHCGAHSPQGDGYEKDIAEAKAKENVQMRAFGKLTDDERIAVIKDLYEKAEDAQDRIDEALREGHCAVSLNGYVDGLDYAIKSIAKTNYERKSQKEILDAVSKLSDTPLLSNLPIINSARAEAANVLYRLMHMDAASSYLTPRVMNALKVAADDMMHPREDVSQIKWERDQAIEQLDKHCIPFCGVVDPLDMDELLEAGGCLWFELRKDFIEEGLVKDVDEENRKAVVVFVETTLELDLDEYNKSWRAWYERPTVEDCNTAEWEGESNE